MKLSNRSGLLASFVITVALFASGCQTMGTFGNKNIPTDNSAKSTAQYQVVMAPAVGKAQVYTGNISENLTVQGALEESGALKKFRTMKIDLFRVVEGSGQTLKMACELQPSKKIVKFEQDYQILPGDRLVVTADNGGIDKILKRN